MFVFFIRLTNHGLKITGHLITLFVCTACIPKLLINPWVKQCILHTKVRFQNHRQLER